MMIFAALASLLRSSIFSAQTDAGCARDLAAAHFATPESGSMLIVGGNGVGQSPNIAAARATLKQSGRAHDLIVLTMRHDQIGSNDDLAHIGRKLGMIADELFATHRESHKLGRRERWRGDARKDHRHRLS